MMVTINIFGRWGSKGYQIYPNQDQSLFEYIEKGKHHDESWQLLIKKNQNTVQYIYLKYYELSSISDPSTIQDGVLGISIEIVNYYFTSIVRNLIPLFQEFFNEIQLDGKLIAKINNRICYIHENFHEVSPSLDLYIKVLKETLLNDLKDQYCKLSSSIPNNSLQEEVLPYTTEDEKVNEAFIRTGTIIIKDKVHFHKEPRLQPNEIAYTSSNINTIPFNGKNVKIQQTERLEEYPVKREKKIHLPYFNLKNKIIEIKPKKNGKNILLLTLSFLAILSLAIFFYPIPKHHIVIIKIAGSNTIGAKLIPELAKEFLEKKLKAKDIIIIQDSLKKEEKTIQGKLNGEICSIQIAAYGSGSGFDSIKHNWADIGMSSRTIKQEEIEKLTDKGISSSRESEYVIAMDGIAVIINKGNNINDLSKEQITKVFSGEYTNWSQLKGVNREIHIYTRKEPSGTWDTFNDLELKPFKKTLVSNAKKMESNQILSEAVSKDLGGIGYTTFSEIGLSKAVGVYEKGTIPLLPCEFTIKTEDYPLSRRLYLYTNNKNKYTKDFIDFIQSEDGQHIVSKIGFVSSTLNLLKTSSIDESKLTEDYKRKIDAAQRLDVNIRFLKGNDTIDNKAYRDLPRIIEKLTPLVKEGKKIILIGFADNIGNSEKNRKLSIKRAQSVSIELERYGIHPEVCGFGQDIPVASNETEEGRHKNRRVEIWVK